MAFRMVTGEIKSLEHFHSSQAHVPEDAHAAELAAVGRN